MRAHLIATLIFVASLMPTLLAAQSTSMSVTVTPPLIQLTIGPGETWKSALKIVNSNTYDVDYYATPVDFVAEGEGGKSKFIPLIEESAASTTARRSLGHWIEISKDPIHITQGRSGEVPFTIRVPEDAEPGGHYAAILVGTKPADRMTEGPLIRIASYVSSLIFLRIDGEIIEKGRIREFLTDRSLYQVPEADFSLRFENQGNTHLTPRGDVVLYNMWGKERGRVTLNGEGHFGNVLPQTIRKFNFSWKGEENAFDIGRYHASVTLQYGQETKQTTTATTYFWVVPVVPVSITLGTIFFFMVLLIFLIRRYVRRVVQLEKNRLGIPHEAVVPVSYSMQSFMRPLEEGAVDLRRVNRAPLPRSDIFAPQAHEEKLSLIGFLQKYSLFFFFVAMIAAFSILVWTYMSTVLIPERSYEINNLESREESIPAP